MKIVLFHWTDATIYANESYRHDHKFDLISGFVSGILVQEDENKITVARDMFDEDGIITYRGLGTYPKTGINGAITDFYEIEDKEKNNA